MLSQDLERKGEGPRGRRRPGCTDPERELQGAREVRLWKSALRHDGKKVLHTDCRDSVDKQWLKSTQHIGFLISQLHWNIVVAELRCIKLCCLRKELICMRA